MLWSLLGCQGHKTIFSHFVILSEAYTTWKADAPLRYIVNINEPIDNAEMVLKLRASYFLHDLSNVTAIPLIIKIHPPLPNKEMIEQEQLFLLNQDNGQRSGSIMAGQWDVEQTIIKNIDWQPGTYYIDVRPANNVPAIREVGLFIYENITK